LPPNPFTALKISHTCVCGWGPRPLWGGELLKPLAVWGRKNGMNGRGMGGSGKGRGGE